MIIALMIVAFLCAIASALIVSTTIEIVITASYRTARETLYAADAAIERTIGTLSTLVDWSPLITAAPGNSTADFSDAESAPVAPGGRVLDLAQLTASRQAASNAVYGSDEFGADAPQWRLFAHARLQDLVPADIRTSSAYVLVWVADDGMDGDGLPEQDSNGTLLVYADAYGVGSARRAIEATVARTPRGTVSLLSWKEVR